MLGVRHLALRVRNLKRSLDFYTRIMNMRVEWQPDADNAYLTSGSDNLALHQVSAVAETTAAALDHFGFLVATPDEVDLWARDLTSRGIELVQQPKTHRDGARSIYFRDPDGNLIQLLYHPPISRAML
jgi:catechol 2,3-dioxygenase-like lactoylglutathione lyase family enzyme